MIGDAVQQAPSGKMGGHLFLASPNKDSPKANSLLSCKRTTEGQSLFVKV